MTYKHIINIYRYREFSEVLTPQGFADSHVIRVGYFRIRVGYKCHLLWLQTLPTVITRSAKHVLAFDMGVTRTCLPIR